VKRLTVWLGLAWGGLFLAPPLSAQGYKLRATLEGHTDEVLCVAVSPDGKTIASGGHDNTIRFWDVASGKEQAALNKAAVYGVESLAFSPDGKTLASGLGGNTIKFWDVETRRATTLLDKVSEYAGPLVVFSSDGKTLATGGRCIREIRLWDLTTGKSIATLAGHDVYGVKAMAFIGSDKYLVSVGHDALIKLWDVAAGKKLEEREMADWPPAAAFSSDGKKLATATWVVERSKDANVVTDKRVKLWDVGTGKELAALKGHTKMTSAVVFSPDGKTLATGSEDRTIKLWDVATGDELATLKGHAGKVTSLAFSADSRMLVSGSEDRTVKLWDVARGK
jgi:WD40 repeat protein